MDRLLTHSVCELRRGASGRTRFAARRGRGVKDHGRAQETVVIGAMRPLVIGLRRLRWVSDAEWCSDGVQEVLRFGGAKSWQEFVGERLLTYRYDRYARLRG